MTSFIFIVAWLFVSFVIGLYSLQVLFCFVQKQIYM